MWVNHRCHQYCIPTSSRVQSSDWRYSISVGMKSTEMQTLGAYICTSVAGAHETAWPHEANRVHKCACTFFHIAKNGRQMITVQCVKCCNEAVSEKSPRLFWPLLPVEYVTAFQDTPDVRCWLTDTHTQTHTHTYTHTDNPTTVTLPVHVHRGLITQATPHSLISQPAQY